MPLVTAVLLGRKYYKHRVAQKEARQGHLELGDADVARNAFASEASRSQDCKLLHASTEMSWDSPEDVALTASSDSPALNDTAAKRQTEQDNADGRPECQNKDNPAVHTREAGRSLDESPPPYSPQAVQPTGVSAQTASPLQLSPTSSKTNSKTASTMSEKSHIDPQVVRVSTIGSDLKSGFPYDPALFDLRIRPDDWERFTGEIIEATKFSVGDHAKLWATSASVALTGAVVTSAFVGRSLNRSIQAKKVRNGLEDMSDGGLGEKLQSWNETYFNSLGLFAHLESSDRATRQGSDRSKLSKRQSLSSSKEERERKKEDRKFVIVMSKLSEDGVPAKALQELDASKDAVEMPVQQEPMTFIAELPGDEGQAPIELPASGPNLDVKDTSPVDGATELPAELPTTLDASTTKLVKNELPG